MDGVIARIHTIPDIEGSAVAVSLVVFREGEYLKLFSDMGVIRDLEKLRIAFKQDLKYTQ